MLLSDYFNNIADYNRDPEWNFNDMTLVDYFGHVYGGQCQHSISALIVFCNTFEIACVCSHLKRRQMMSFTYQYI
jgi:hypothetical protein